MTRVGSPVRFHKDCEMICRFQIFILTSLAFREGCSFFFLEELFLFQGKLELYLLRKRHLNQELSKISKKKAPTYTDITVQLV